MNTKKQLRYIEHDLNGIIVPVTQETEQRDRHIVPIAKCRIAGMHVLITIGHVIEFLTLFPASPKMFIPHWLPEPNPGRA